jgi:hypothetical protein
MFDSTQEKEEKAKALRKLMKKWLMAQETQRKADLLLSKNPELRRRKTTEIRKDV